MFYLIRDTDVTGVSGTGIVAQGCLFDNGHAAITWLGETASDVIWTPSITESGEPLSALEKIMRVHGHNGATRVVFVGHSVSGVVELESNYNGSVS